MDCDKDTGNDNHEQYSIIIARSDNNNKLVLDWSQVMEWVDEEHDEENRREVPFPTDEVLSINNHQAIKILNIKFCPHPLPSVIFDELRELEYLYFWICSYLDALPSMRNLSKMERLCIRNCNELTEFPPSIRSAQNLKTLEIWSCDSIESIPQWIGQLSNLRTLSIKFCPITGLPTSIGNLINLEELVVEGTKINSLPSEMCMMTGLQELRIFDGHSNLEASTTYATIQNLPHLQFLRLWSSSNFINSLPLLPQLKKLELDITEDDVSRITIFDGDKTWKDDSSLEYLSICYPELDIDEDDTDVDIQHEDRTGILGGCLPRTLRDLRLTNLYANRILDTLPNESHRLPQGLLELELFDCSRTPYSQQERLRCIRMLVERHERLGSITIEDDINSQLLNNSFPLHETFLLKFNQCGRILVQSNEGTTVKPIPLSIWPTVFARVHNQVVKDESWKLTDHDEELEASILFRLLQSAVFLGRDPIDIQNNTTTRATRKRKCFD